MAIIAFVLLGLLVWAFPEQTDVLLMLAAAVVVGWEMFKNRKGNNHGPEDRSTR